MIISGPHDGANSTSQTQVFLLSRTLIVNLVVLPNVRLVASISLPGKKNKENDVSSFFYCRYNLERVRKWRNKSPDQTDMLSF